jgi:hypothetical protein
MPLVYVFKDKLNQPIFGCNNLAGQQQQQQQPQQQQQQQKDGWHLGVAGC